jgi:membrane protein YdbS with pleckstrin-like domain
MEYTLLIVFGFIVVLSIIKATLSYHNRKLQHKEKLMAIEKGIPLPSEQPSAPMTAAACNCTAKHSRRKGIILTCIGLGIVFSFVVLSYIVQQREVASVSAFGLILVMIGVGYFIDAFLLYRDEKKAESLKTKEDK